MLRVIRMVRGAVRSRTCEVLVCQPLALKRFETTTRTNWHYECANALIDGSLKVSACG